jgi:phosphoribosyl 1,2-cyclic phosphodiesterase
MMKVRFWGTRGSIATPGVPTMRYGGNTSCVEVRSGNHILVFDAGTGIRGLGNDLIREFPNQPLEVHLFISHTHWDHIQGFPFFLPAYRRENKIHIYGPPGRDKSLEKILKIQMDSDYFPVELGDMNKNIEFHEVRDPVQIGPLTIDHFYLNHPALCLAYRVSEGKRSVVYATDNEPYYGSLHSPRGKGKATSDVPDYLDEKFVEFLKGAEIYIGEAQYTNAEYNEKKGWGHSPLEATVRFAVQANAGQLALYHHDPMHDDAFVDAMVNEANALVKTFHGATKCIGAKEGMELILG